MSDLDKFFREVTIRICGSLNLNQALRDTHIYLKNRIPIDMMHMSCSDAVNRVITSLAVSNYGVGITLKKKVTPSPELQKQLERDNLKKAEFFVTLENNVGENPTLYDKECFEEGCDLNVSRILMILELDEYPLGVVDILANGLDRFTPEHAEMISILHRPFSIAMSNYQKHSEVLEMKKDLEIENEELHKTLRDEINSKIKGENGGLKEVLNMVRQVARLDSPVLLLGETGVGKEVIANEIYRLSERKNKPFIKVNCGAIPDNLFDSELFGHEKGAFTGAASQKKGRFERANNGTIFLDEIGELPLQAQVRLLRVIQNGEIERVGGSESISLNVRIICATHQNLEEMVQKGTFREDLWYRINVFPIRIPPLRQRKEDIPGLVHYFINKKSKELKLRPVPVLAEGELEALTRLAWKGNVRELENMTERALILIRDQRPQPPLTFSTETDSFGKKETIKAEKRPVSRSQIKSLDTIQAEYIASAIDLCNGKIHGPNGAAELLKINPHTLRNRMRKMGIPFGNKSNSVTR